MKNIVITCLLLASGAIAAGVGFAVLISPAGFYLANGIELPQNPSMMSEVRAPAVTLVVIGAVVLISAIRVRWHKMGLLVATAVFGAYGVARVLSVGLDGMPTNNLLAAAALELAVAGLCAVAFFSHRRA